MNGKVAKRIRKSINGALVNMPEVEYETTEWMKTYFVFGSPIQMPVTSVKLNNKCRRKFYKLMKRDYMRGASA